MKTEQDLLQAVNERLLAAMDRMKLRSKDPALTVLTGHQNQLIELTLPSAETVEEDLIINESVMRFEGNTLRVEDTLNGSASAGVQLVDDGSYFRYTVAGNDYVNGVARARNMRRSQGGLLVWEYTMVLNIISSTVVEVRFSPDVTLRSRALHLWPEAIPVTAKVNEYDTAPSVDSGTTSGSVYQLAGVYGPDGIITIYKLRPGTYQVAPGSGWYNNAFFNALA